MSIDSWSRVLLSSGFSGLEVEMQDCEDDDYSAMSVMMTKALPNSKDSPTEAILVHNGNPPSQRWLEGWKGTACVGSSISSLQDLTASTIADKISVFIGELETPCLHHLGQESFDKLKELLISAKGLLWVTRGANKEATSPQSSLHLGLVRTLRAEYPQKRFATLDLDPARAASPAEDGQCMSDVLERAFDFALDETYLDFEYVERNGSILVERIVEDPDSNLAVQDDRSRPRIDLQPFSQAGRPLSLHIERLGRLDTLSFKDHEAVERVPSGHVEVEPRAFGVNHVDLSAALGRRDESRMGHECSGIITRISSDTKEYQIGDRVCGLMNGSYASVVLMQTTSLVRIPMELSFEVAASIPIAFTTAYHMLYQIARIQSGETVLIQASAGDVGQAASMLAQLVGSEVFALVDSSEQRQSISRSWGIPIDYTLSSSDADVTDTIKRATGNRGVDVLLTSTTKALQEELINCITPFGRLVEVKNLGVDVTDSNLTKLLKNSVSYTSFDIEELQRFKPDVVAGTLSRIMELFANGQLKPLPQTVFPISDVEKALRLVESENYSGKVLVRPGQTDIVKVSSQWPRPQLSPSHSYLIIGGISGLGRSIAHHLASLGARNLVLVSRNASTHHSVPELTKSLSALGCTVSIHSCDISSECALRSTLSNAALTMPPIAGVIQGAMVLQDTVFSNMTHSDWLKPVQPKVQGTQNLHTLSLEPSSPLSNLAFFITLSSLTGIGGSPSQANYTAGNSFQDALMAHRHAAGQPGVSINLGAIQDVGIVARTEGTESRLRRWGYEPLTEKEMLAFVSHAIANPQLGAGALITGIATGAAADWSAMPWRQDARFAGLRTPPALLQQNPATGDEDGAVPNLNLSTVLSGATQKAAAIDAATTVLAAKLAEMFVVDVKDLEPDRPIASLGLDSLIAVELRNWLALAARCEMSVFDVMQSGTVKGLAGMVVERSELVGKGVK